MNLSASNTDFGTSVISLLASFSKLLLTPSIAQTNTHTTLSPNLRSAELSLLLEPHGVWLSLLLERHICEVQICNRFWSLVLVVAKCRTVIMEPFGDEVRNLPSGAEKWEVAVRWEGGREGERVGGGRWERRWEVGGWGVRWEVGGGKSEDRRRSLEIESID